MVLTEKWRWVVGYRGYYKVSDHGRVKSVDRVVGAGRGRTRIFPGRVLTQFKGNNFGPNSVSHLQVKLSKNGVTRTHQVHTLVLEAFVGCCPIGMECRHHPDQDPTNNRLENLSWASRTTNVNDRIENNTTNRGENQGRSKLTWRKVRIARRLRSMDSKQWSQQKLADLFAVSRENMGSLLRGETWKEQT